MHRSVVGVAEYPGRRYKSRTPSKRLSHSSQSENAAIAAADTTAIRALLVQKSISRRAAFVSEKPGRDKQEGGDRQIINVKNCPA